MVYCMAWIEVSLGLEGRKRVIKAVTEGIRGDRFWDLSKQCSQKFGNAAQISFDECAHSFFKMRKNFCQSKDEKGLRTTSLLCERMRSTKITGVPMSPYQLGRLSPQMNLILGVIDRLQ
jgi:hypothetical protein